MRAENRFFRLILLFLGILITVSGCGENKDMELTNEPVLYPWEEAIVYEAEVGTQAGDPSVKSENGVGFVEDFHNADTDYARVTFITEEEGFYDLGFMTSSGGAYKLNHVRLDGEMIGDVVTESREFERSILPKVYLTKGTHDIDIVSSWGYIRWDSLQVKKADEYYPNRFEVEPVLCNPNASDNARRLMHYLCDIYGKQILSGQVCDGGMFGLENAAIWRTTGEFPAILGMDMMDYTLSRAENGTQGRSVGYALDYWEESNGITALCWHWTAPSEYITGTWYSAFYKEHTNINLDKIMNGEDDTGLELLKKDIRTIAEEMKPLKEADVPILWRPLHEASGGWFWWGNCKSESYIALYRMMYDIMVNEYELNNLIWVWNGQDEDWYPGDEYVDIVGTDIYPGYQVAAPQTAQFERWVRAVEGRKIVALTENGCVFDVDLAQREGAMWSFFDTWCGEFVLKVANLNFYSEQYTTEEILKKAYESDIVVKRSGLPDLKNYPLPE